MSPTILRLLNAHRRMMMERFIIREPGSDRLSMDGGRIITRTRWPKCLLSDFKEDLLWGRGPAETLEPNYEINEETN